MRLRSLISILFMLLALVGPSVCLSKEVTRSPVTYNTPVAIDSRIKTYIYNENEVFPVTLHYGYSTHIDLDSRENVRDIILGESAEWSISVRQNRIFISANENNAHTNMTVITNRNIYEFDLFARSAKGGIDRDLSYVVRFFYPPSDEELEQILGMGKKNVEQQRSEQEKQVISRLLSDSIDYSFKYKGDTAIAPLVTFTDGKLIYFKFPNNETLPLIFETHDNGEKLLDMLEYNGYIIVNSTAPKLLLKHKRYKVIVEKT